MQSQLIVFAGGSTVLNRFKIFSRELIWRKGETVNCLFCSQKSEVQQENYETMDKRTMRKYLPKPTTLRDHLSWFCSSMFTEPSEETTPQWCRDDLKLLKVVHQETFCKALQVPLFSTFSFSLRQTWTNWQNLFLSLRLILNLLTSHRK